MNEDFVRPTSSQIRSGACFGTLTSLPTGQTWPHNGRKYLTNQTTQRD
jgi:hypothetical protein